MHIESPPPTLPSPFKKPVTAMIKISRILNGQVRKEFSKLGALKVRLKACIRIATDEGKNQYRFRKYHVKKL